MATLIKTCISRPVFIANSRKPMNSSKNSSHTLHGCLGGVDHRRVEHSFAHGVLMLSSTLLFNLLGFTLA
jgi:hypothetical protein